MKTSSHWFLPTANKSSGEGSGKKSDPPNAELAIKGFSSSADRINSGLQDNRYYLKFC